MAQLPTKDHRNGELKALEASDTIFKESKRHHVVSEAVRFQMAKRRRGTHQAKTRSFIAASSKKPFPQKGTGNARRGDSRSPLLRGGGVVFPPQPRSYAFSMTKKSRKAALRAALSDKLESGKLFVLKEHGLTEVKTKRARELFERLGLKGALLVSPKKDDVLEKSVRNMDDFKVLRAEGLNVYDVLRFEHLVILSEALPTIERRLG